VDMRFIEHGPTGKALAVTPDKQMHDLPPDNDGSGTVTTATLELYPLAPASANPCFPAAREGVQR